jgi:hypothetical protein
MICFIQIHNQSVVLVDLHSFFVLEDALPHMAELDGLGMPSLSFLVFLEELDFRMVAMNAFAF